MMRRNICCIFLVVFLYLQFNGHASLEAEFASQMARVREIRSSREETLVGGWYTEEKMKTELKYGKRLCCIDWFPCF